MWGVKRRFRKVPGNFFTKNDDYFLRNQWKMHIFVSYLAKSFATFVVISKTWNTFHRLNIFYFSSTVVNQIVFRFINNMFNLIRLSSQPLYYVSVKVVPVVDIVRYTYYVYTIK